MQTESRGFTLFLASVNALTSLSIDMSLPAVPAIEHTFALPASHGSLSLSLFLAGYAITPLAGGPLADRFGRRPVLIAALSLFAISALACTAAPTFFVLLLFRLVQGCASGVAVALPLAIVRDLLEGHQARQRIAEVTTINGIMPLVAPILGAWVMLLGGWRVIFGAQAVFGVAVILCIVLYFQESLPADRRQRLHPAHLARNYALLLTNRTFLGYSLVYALNFASVFSFISASPLLLMQRMGVSRSVYTLLFALTVIGTILGSVSSGLLSRRQHSIRRTLSVGLVVMSSASLIAAGLQLARFERPIAILPCVFVMLFCFGLTSPAATLEALETVPHLAGSASGAIRSLQMILGSAASAFLAALCARPGINAPIVTTLTMSAAVLASLILYLAALRRHVIESPMGSPEAAEFLQ